VLLGLLSRLLTKGAARAGYRYIIIITIIIVSINVITITAAGTTGTATDTPYTTCSYGCWFHDHILLTKNKNDEDLSKIEDNNIGKEHTEETLLLHVVLTGVLWDNFSFFFSSIFAVELTISDELCIDGCEIGCSNKGEVCAGEDVKLVGVPLLSVFADPATAIPVNSTSSIPSISSYKYTFS